MKNVLIITYYWPPSGGSGVQRWLNMTQFLHELGYQPIVYTPKNPHFKLLDQLLVSKIHPDTIVLKTNIWEPYGIYERIFGAKKNVNLGAKQQQNWKSKLIQLIRNQLFFPDPRKYWIRPSVKYLSRYCKENNVDYVITTGPPHSLHNIGLQLKEKLNLKWIADFRDPMAEFDLHGSLLSEKGKSKLKQLEQKIVTSCDAIVSTCYSLPELLASFPIEKFHTVTNGYNVDDFGSTQSLPNDKFIILHPGLLNHIRNPEALFKVLNSMCEKHKEFDNLLELRLIGFIDQTVMSSLKSYKNLWQKVVLKDYIGHQELEQEYRMAALFLLLTNHSHNSKVNIPGKLFEYLLFQKPIIAFGVKQNDVETILNRTETGKNFDYSNEEGIQLFLLETFIAWQKSKDNKDDYHVGNAGEIAKFNIKTLAKQYAEIINQL